MSAAITTLSDITLITLEGCPADIGYLASSLETVAAMGVNIDMISMAPAHGDRTAFSITVQDDDLGKILTFTRKLQESTGIRPIVSSGNYKIAVYDPGMKNTPGVAAAVFQAASRAHADLRLISTSDVEISVIVTAADYDAALEELHQALT